MIAERMRHTSYGLRSEAARIGVRRLLIVLTAVFLSFVFAFEMGHVSSETKAPAEVRGAAELSVASVRAQIPVNLSLVPPIAALPIPRPVVHVHHASVTKVAPSSSPGPTAPPQSPTILTTPAPVHAAPAPTAPTGGGTPAESSPQPAHKASPPSSSGGGEGSFDSSD